MMVAGSGSRRDLRQPAWGVAAPEDAYRGEERQVQELKRLIETKITAHWRTLVDFSLMIGVSALVLGVTHLSDLDERLHEFMEANEQHHVDELLVFLFFMVLALLLFAFRRIHDYRAELVRRDKAEDKVRTLAFHDPLTGLPNRRLFAETADLAFERSAEAGGIHAMLALDLNGFKNVNDVFGHLAGDELLIRVSERLRRVVGEDHMVARLGGDEFVVFASDIDGIEEAASIGQRLMDAFSAAFEAAETDHLLAVSIGIAVSPQDGTDRLELLRKADIALYRAKRDSQSSMCFFEPAMDEAVRERTRLERDLRKALSDGKICAHYQPIVDLQTGELRAFEALARWTHPELGAIPPDRFVPLAEETGLIVDLTECILRNASRDALNWPSQTLVSVNLSPILLKDRTFGLRILAILNETGLPPDRLEIEITENGLLSDIELAQSVLNELRSVGIRIALDDFGTGYSSIHHLRSIRFDKIKIDRSYVRSLGRDAENDAFIRAMLGLGLGLGLTITAEGVEEGRQRDELIREGCQEGQGYLFGRPMTAAAALDFISRHTFERPSSALVVRRYSEHTSAA